LAVFYQPDDGKTGHSMLITTIVFIFFLLFYCAALLILLKGLKSFVNVSYPNRFTVSIIVCLHNEEANVPGLLESLFKQEYPQQLLEFIFIDDRSEDHTRMLLEKASLIKDHVKIISISDLQKNFAPKKRAIDTGIQNAKGDIILLTDADGRPGPQWVKSVVENFDNKTGMVIGYAPYYSSGLITQLLSLEYFSHAVVAAASTGLGFPLTCVGTNLAYRKQVYRELEGFGRYRYYHSGDDDLFMQRIRDESTWHIRYVLDPRSQVWNEPPGSLWQFFNQRLRYASKGFYYPWKISFLLILTFLLNIQFVILVIMGIFSFYIALLVLGGIVIKIVCEYMVMYRAKKVFAEKRNVKLIPLLSLLHIPYVVFFALFAQIVKYQWAGKSK
jgi:cellulose synthase/poly-beta-1,6-N-acetylglucosamine synthase-like glycosyltransferase